MLLRIHRHARCFDNRKEREKEVAIKRKSWSFPHLLREDGNSYILCWVGIIAFRSTDSSDQSLNLGRLDHEAHNIDMNP